MEKNNNLKEKVKLKIAISRIKEENIDIREKIKNISISKKISVAACFIFALTGVGFAAQTVVEKIWQEPKSFTINSEITEEDKNNSISEEKAREVAEKYFKKIGLNKEITKLTLTKDLIDNEVFWNVGFKNGAIVIDSDGNIISINIPTWNYKIPYNYGITREEARNVAKELLEKYKLDEDSGEYELVKLTRNMETDEGSYIWYADFYKKYGELLNPYESIHIGWIPTINGLYSLSLKNNNYENNEERISKEDAIKVATEKDKQIETVKVIKETKAEIQIKQMNEKVYLRENFKDEFEKGTMSMIMKKTGENSYQLKEDAVFYKTEKRVRKVWVVVIKYDVPENTGISEFSYYIDCTTGEIIGGSVGDSTQTIEKTISDPYNLIEK